MDRKYVSPNFIRWGENFGVKIPESEMEILNLVQKGVLTVAPLFLIKEVICKNCGSNYLICECNLLMKDKEIKLFEPISMFWTRKSMFS